MQGYTDPPRDGLTVDQVRWLLAHGPQVTVDQGCDLLDANNNVIADISADMVVGGEITGDNTVTGESIAGKCQISLMRELAWGRDRVRPWVSLTNEQLVTTTTTVIDRPAASASRTDNADATWAQGTLANVASSGGALRLTSSGGAPVNQSFAYTGAAQTWTAPISTTVSITLDGAQGGDTAQSSGGRGGRVTFDLPVAAGDVLTFYVGGAGSVSTVGGWNGGGAMPSNTLGGTGGGATDVRLNGTALANRVGVAGGGGGASNNGTTGFANGGAGGGLTGANGAGTTPGLGGTQSAGGAGGGSFGAAGTLGQGGSGSQTAGYQGTGGGGYYGGGASQNALGGGGGGSSYATGTATNVVHTQGSRTGNGAASLTYTGAATYAASGTRVSPALSLSSLVAVDSSSVSWSATVPSGAGLTVETSVNGGASWQAATNGGPIPNVTPGASVQSRLTLTGNGSVTPSVSSLTVSATQAQLSHDVTTSGTQPVTAKFYQGVYVLTTPQQPSGETPVTFDVQGYDLTSLLTDQVGDTYVVASGTTYLQALRNVLTASGVGANLLLAGDAGSTALPYTMVWALYDGGPSWLSICADLLASIGYERLWADEVGNLRSQPATDPATRPLAWTFDVTDGSVDSLVSPGWTRDQDMWSAPNKWTFIQSNTNGVSPTVANGMVYKVTNQSDGPLSIDALSGRVRTKVVYLDVPDAATLKVQGDLAVAADKAASVSVSLQTFLPAIGHGDVVQFLQPGRSEKLPVATWTTNLDGSQGAWTLGLPATQPDTPLSASGYATVTQASPLRIVMDGATVDSPANSLDGAAYAVGARVTCTVRSPVPPLVQGVESPTA